MKVAAEVVLIFKNLFVLVKEKALKVRVLTAGSTLSQATAWLNIERAKKVQTALVNGIVEEEEKSFFTETMFHKKAEIDADDD